jgi:hypothetical protein
MESFLAKIIYQVICGEGNHTPQFDEQLRLIIAPDFENAVLKANEIGIQEQQDFYNQKGKLVKWKFIAVCEMYSISNYNDGMEILSTIKERRDEVFYINEVLQKSMKIQPLEIYS